VWGAHGTCDMLKPMRDEKITWPVPFSVHTEEALAEVRTAFQAMAFVRMALSEGRRHDTRR